MKCDPLVPLTWPPLVCVHQERWQTCSLSRSLLLCSGYCSLPAFDLRLLPIPERVRKRESKERVHGPVISGASSVVRSGFSLLLPYTLCAAGLLSAHVFCDVACGLTSHSGGRALEPNDDKRQITQSGSAPFGGGILSDTEDTPFGSNRPLVTTMTAAGWFVA